MKSKFDTFNSEARQQAPDPHYKLWKAWSDSGKSAETLEPLMDAMEPFIQSAAKRALKGLGGSIPYSALEQQYRIAAKRGLESYDPERGTKVRTHVTTNFQRTSDFVDPSRNFAHIPKPRVNAYQKFMNAKNEFMREHGHEPTLEDMKRLLPGMPENTLAPMMNEIRRELYIGGNPDPNASDDGSLGHAPSQVRSVLSLMPSMLSAEEKKVFDHLFPSLGEPLTVGQIAKKTGLSQNQVYRLRSSIYEKAKPHLGGI